MFRRRASGLVRRAAALELPTCASPDVSIGRAAALHRRSDVPLATCRTPAIREGRWRWELSPAGLQRPEKEFG